MMTTVTISRQFGSGGRKIATRVSELLGCRFFDKYLMARLVAELGLSESEIVDYSEDHYKAMSFMERLGTAFALSGASSNRGSVASGTLTTEQLDQAQIVKMVKMSILAAYERGRVVIVGRGGQVILRDKPDVVHVRIVAPMETRLARLQEYEGLSADEARRLIAERDQAGAEYLSRYFDAQLNDPLLYHLVLNTGKWQPEMAAQIIVNAVDQIQSYAAT